MRSDDTPINHVNVVDCISYTKAKLVISHP